MTTDELKGLVLAILRRHGPTGLQRLTALCWAEWDKPTTHSPDYDVFQALTGLTNDGLVVSDFEGKLPHRNLYSLAAPTPPSTPDALFARVLANHGDDAARLVYADCLEDHGMPETAAWWRKVGVRRREPWKGKSWIVVEEPYPGYVDVVVPHTSLPREG